MLARPSTLWVWSSRQSVRQLYLKTDWYRSDQLYRRTSFTDRHSLILNWKSEPLLFININKRQNFFYQRRGHLKVLKVLFVKEVKKTSFSDPIRNGRITLAENTLYCYPAHKSGTQTHKSSYRTKYNFGSKPEMAKHDVHVPGAILLSLRLFAFFFSSSLPLTIVITFPRGRSFTKCPMTHCPNLRNGRALEELLGHARSQGTNPPTHCNYLMTNFYNISLY